MKVQEFKPDLMTSAGGKMLAAFFIAMRIEPSLAGLIKATGNDPEMVFAAINEGVEKAPHVLGQVETLLTMLRESGERQVRIEAKLDVLLGEMGFEPCPSPRDLTPLEIEHDNAAVTAAVLDEASGRS